MEGNSNGIQSINASNFVKELETSFWDFVHKLFEQIILWKNC